MIQRIRNGAIKVFIVEDHKMFREWLWHMVSTDDEFAVCGEADNIGVALMMIKDKQPDIAIVDISLSGGSSGLELIKELKAHRIAVPVLVLSMHEEEMYAERVIQAGGKGYISKNEPSTTLVKAMRHVLSGQVYLSEKMTAAVLAKLSDSNSPARSFGLKALTDRQLEVFQLIGKGYNGREIARQLHLGPTTIDTYRARIKEKLRIKNSAELYSRAAEMLRGR
jgi:DNA-binding NarL/FixJ family response regulator